MLGLVIAAFVASSAPQAAAARVAGASGPAVKAGQVSVFNPQSIASLMQKAGYRAKLVTDDGNPYLESSAEGANFTIFWQNCKEGRSCEDLMLRSSYVRDKEKPATLKTINDFNREFRFTRAYLDKDSDPVIEMDIIFTDGLMDAKAFEEHIEIWSNSLNRFHKAIDF